MSTFLNPYRIIPIQSSDQFEDFCCEVARDWFGDFAAQRYGRSGQKQGGIDINATNRLITAANNKGGGQKVVVQCKYKKDPKNYGSADAIREIEHDLQSAIASHQFDVFIYASTLERRTELKDNADALTLLYNKEVQIWFWDDLEQAVHIHPRLQRMYAEGSISSGVQLLHPDILKSLESRQADPFHFYTAKVDGDWQWLGVCKGLAAQRKCRPAIDEMLDTLFAKPFLDTKIAAVVYGEGGSGKSTLLRQLAIDRAKQGYICWWVENMADFINHDAKSISENSQLRHLVFMEDWYRNMKDKSGTDFFTWLKGQHNVLVLIGDRSFQSSVYGSYCYHDSKYQLLPSENRNVLKHIATFSKDYGAILAKFDELPTLLDHAALFMILFVATALLNERDTYIHIDLKDGVLTAFQNIIAKKLLALEEDEHHHGFGKALHLLASIYASESMVYTIFPEDFFLNAAAYLGDNEELIERIAMCGYPEEVNALVNKRTVVTKSKGKLHFIKFNHDILAEQGIVYADEHKVELAKALSLDNHSLTKLLNTLTGNSSPNGVLILWLWLHTERQMTMNDKAIEQLMKVLKNGLANVTGPVFKAVLFALPSRDLRTKVCRFVLEQPNFFSTLPYQIVSTALNKAGAEPAKTAAEIILSQDDFFSTLSDSIVSTALSKAGAEPAKTAAEIILSQDDFFSTLPFEIVSTALNKAGAEPAKTAAEIILSQDDFFSTLPDSIVSTALNKAGAEPAKTAAEIILSQDDFFSTLPYQIVSRALQILKREGSALQAARTILNNLKQIYTFLVFQAIKTLLHSNIEEDRVLIHKIVDEINYHLRRESKGFSRLYYDLLYLPLFDIPSHQEKVNRVFTGYRPTAQRHAKYNAYRVLSCYNEYPDISYFQDEVKALSERILSGCIADIEFQRKEHPQDLIFGHISYALRHPALVADAAQAKKHILAYAEQYPDFQQSALYKEVTVMAVDFL